MRIEQMTKLTTALFLTACFLSIGTLQADEKNNAAAENPIVKMAEQGNALAQAKLGSMYLLGRDDVQKDEKKAAEWMEKSAQQGFLEAQVIVAAMYDRGLGVVMDVKRATSWYEKAAAQGHKPSLAILGRNEIAKGGIAFDYKRIRLGAAKQIPNEYAKQILRKK